MDENLHEFVTDTQPILGLIGTRIASLEEGSGDLSGLDEVRRLLCAIDGRAEPLALLRLRHLLARLLGLVETIAASAGPPDALKVRALRAGFDRMRWQVSVLARLQQEAPGDDQDLVAAERRAVVRPQPGVPGRSATPGVLLEEEVERLRAEFGADMVPTPRAHLQDLARLAGEVATIRQRLALPACPETPDFENALEALCRAGFDLADRARPRGSPTPATDSALLTPAVRVLLVDDQEFFRTLLARVLTGAGYQVTTATSAREAFALVTAGPDPDAVITDLGLPETDGFGLARAILAHPRRRELPILGLAPHAGPELFVSARAAGLRRVIGKFDREALLAWLAQEVSPAVSPARSHAA